MATTLEMLNDRISELQNIALFFELGGDEYDLSERDSLLLAQARDVYCKRGEAALFDWLETVDNCVIRCNAGPWDQDNPHWEIGEEEGFLRFVVSDDIIGLIRIAMDSPYITKIK